ncbi:hypothetical protein SAMN05428957_11279 [Oryzisolibacter propanilivorax]|uniref:Secreted protein n=1 Tax=Oryzisolibacter propanilivorax TaxID=1527607 RepID=A0A1G9VFN2_9BURK|nr:hypothetical protein [Oryzisolibacter propanilivorax]SDM70867.1 hypothetical protein SAMN05428957_11279 [Oryzisolibacter propanilivorax]
MQRCPLSICPRAARLCAAALAGVLALAPLAPLAATAQAPIAGQRTFPAQAQAGTLKILDRNQAELDGKPIRLAPGLRLFNEKNALVFAHTVAQRPLAVRYVREASTGWLLTAWMLTPAEAELARKGSAGHAPQTLPATQTAR